MHSARSIFSTFLAALLLSTSSASLVAAQRWEFRSEEEVAMENLDRKLLKYQKRVFNAHLRGKNASKAQRKLEAIREERTKLREKLLF